MKENERLTLLAGAPLMGSVRVRHLVDCFGSAEAAIEAGSESWMGLPGFSSRVIDSWNRWYRGGQWEQNLELVERFSVKLVSYRDSNYPKGLLELADCPVVLYVKGELTSQDEKALAVVGTRNASIYGLETAEKISMELAGLGFVIVSGLARGIDTAAHRAALKRGRTIAVIGSGLANVYPRENMRLSEEIGRSGALMSEFPMNTPPDRHNFPQRNRIVSGMTLGTLLIEAPLKSGAMLTMERAFSQKRKLFTIPGRIDSENFRGNLHLLKEKRAILVESAQEIANQVDKSYTFESSGKKTFTSNKVFLDQEEHSFLDLLPKEELSLEKIAQLAGLPVKKIQVLLMGLLLKCAVKEYPGKIYKKLV